MTRQRIARAARFLLLVCLAIGLPVVLVGSAVMSRVESPLEASESDVQRARELAVTAVVDYVTGHPDVEELKGTPLELSPSELRPIVAAALTDDVVRGLLERLQAALGGYLDSTRSGFGRLVLKLGPEKDLLVAGLLQHWSSRLDQLPTCDRPRPQSDTRVAAPVSSERGALLSLLHCRPPPELKALLLDRVAEHLREMDGAGAHELVIFTGQLHDGQADLAPWLGRLRHAGLVFGNGSLVALALVLLAALGFVAVARLDKLSHSRILWQLGLALLVSALLLLAASVALRYVSGDTDYFRWLLQRPAGELTREETLGIRLAVYVFNRVLQDAGAAIFAMAAGIGLASVSTLGAARLTAADRTSRRPTRRRRVIANTLVSQVKKTTRRDVDARGSMIIHVS